MSSNDLTFQLDEEQALQLAGDIGRLESLNRRLYVREIADEQRGRMIEQQTLNEATRLIRERRLLHRYSREQEFAGDKLVHLELILQRAKADIAAFHSRKEFLKDSVDRKDEMIVATTTLLRKLPSTLFMVIVVPLLLSFAASYWQVASFKDQESFKSNYSEIRNLVTELTDIQLAAVSLRAETIRKEQATTGKAAALVPLNGALKLRRTFEKTVQPFAFGHESPIKVAQLTSNFELEALIYCLILVKDGWNDAELEEKKAKMHDQIDDLASRGHISSEQAAGIKKQALIESGCGDNFDPDSFRQLTLEVSILRWSYTGGNPFEGR